MLNLNNFFKNKISNTNEQPQSDASAAAPTEVPQNSGSLFETNRASGNHVADRLDDLSNDLAALSLPENDQSHDFREKAEDQLVALQQNLLNFSSSDKDLSQTDLVLNEALDFLQQKCIEELKHSLTTSDDPDQEALSSFLYSTMDTILKVLDAVLDYGINTVRSENSEEMYDIKLENLKNHLLKAKASFACAQCEKEIMIRTREKEEAKLCVQHISSTAPLSKKAELLVLKKTIRTLALTIDASESEWNSNYLLSLIAPDVDMVGLSEEEKVKLRKQEEERLKQRVKQIEKNYEEISAHLNASSAIIDTGDEIIQKYNDEFSGMLNKENKREISRVQQRMAQLEQDALHQSQTAESSKQRTTI
ncbi:MAG: hypothetical protein SO016_03505 [Lachnospiraceae bacterium]|nr:hypothetical protein [Robinsoniella sp.]MDY3765752.1 hypothetical protein [Lachnospiraceae bacterium]